MFAYPRDATGAYDGAVSTTTVAAGVRERVLRSRERFWRPEDFDGSPEAVTQALSRMARAGKLRRIRRGLYWRGSPTPLGMAPPPADRLAGAMVHGPGSGPAGLSAASVLGLSTQVPRHDTIAVAGRAPRGSGPLRFVSRAAATKRRDERLRPNEVALLEVLRDWNHLVEVPAPEALGHITHFADAGVIRLDRVANASPSEPPRARERLRHLLCDMERPDLVSAVPPARSRSLRREPALAL